MKRQGIKESGEEEWRRGALLGEESERSERYRGH